MRRHTRTAVIGEESMPIMRWLAAGALALSLALPGSGRCAEVSDYPNRKIIFMVGFAPGGGIDTFARVLAQGLTEQFGYSIVIENRPGAASNIAARAVANAAPDGYTFLVTGNSLAINQTYYEKSRLHDQLSSRRSRSRRATAWRSRSAPAIRRAPLANFWRPPKPSPSAMGSADRRRASPANMSSRCWASCRRRRCRTRAARPR